MEPGNCVDDLAFVFSLLTQLLMKELQQSQIQVKETNTLANKLLTLYGNDDTHKVTQINNNMDTACIYINKR